MRAQFDEGVKGFQKISKECFFVKLAFHEDLDPAEADKNKSVISQKQFSLQVTAKERIISYYPSKTDSNLITFTSMILVPSKLKRKQYHLDDEAKFLVGGNVCLSGKKIWRRMYFLLSFFDLPSLKTYVRLLIIGLLEKMKHFIVSWTLTDNCLTNSISMLKKVKT